ncbi:hypothetical protein [Enterococcus sp. C50]|uniref:hypothetical protein n=1 Tax=Enterococcus sp. C50 TaxID=3231311 RepID=UPI00349FF7FE
MTMLVTNFGKVTINERNAWRFVEQFGYDQAKQIIEDLAETTAVTSRRGLMYYVNPAFYTSEQWKMLRNRNGRS